ncbi:MAG: S8 family serine peptidase, partial [Bdellovibrionales bacterium]|nr:S8 family serine peptidase [Bdellovibrionales bacterium]
ENPDKFRPGVCGCSEPETDSDGDGVPDCEDECADDATKAEAGTCGCGSQDTDSDDDGTPDCTDFCAQDPNKVAPGVCGCGQADTDSDGDGTPDCNDDCQSDPLKTRPGACGCGTPDTDSDNDGAPDCNDMCPNNNSKMAPGICGCDQADADTDSDGTLDCNDQCPEDENKQLPGICGCSVADTDTDGDGTADCDDLCADDPDKTSPGICGCGTSEADTDGDGTKDCQDSCPEDAAKVVPGECGCGEVEGSCDQEDLCPDNPKKFQPGVCGCDEEEEDSNNNGLIDCEEDGESEDASNSSAFEPEIAALSEVKAVKTIAELMGPTADTINQLFSKIDGLDISSLIDANPENHIIKQATEFSAFVDFTKVADAACRAETDAFFANILTPELIAKAEQGKDDVLPFDLVRAVTPEDITVGELTNKLNNQSCKWISGIADDVEVNATGIYTSGFFNDSNYGSQNYFQAINFEQAYPYFNQKASNEVPVAFIDTGFDMDVNADLVQFHEILEGSNQIEYYESTGERGDHPQDSFGHGTATASIVASPRNNNRLIAGIAGAKAKILPIRIMRDGSSGDDTTFKVFHAIRYAVNAGAKIVNMSIGQANPNFCNPYIGEAIFRAIEKGVTFIFAAGNGYPDENGVYVPIEITGPTDHGPQQFGKTMAPACWGRYFKGALSVAATDTGSGELATFSNFGKAIELSAPGTNITTVGLGGTAIQGTGTSFSAPIATAAATLIYSAFKADNRYLSPWLLEDILLNGSPSHGPLLPHVHRGKKIDLKALSDYLTELDGMTEDERKRIPSENQNVGMGWDPEKDIERIAEIIVKPQAPAIDEIVKGQSIQMQAFIRYFDGTLREITEDPKVYWTARYQPQGKTSITPKAGMLTVNRNADLEFGSGILIIAHYGNDFEGRSVVTLVPENQQATLKKLKIGTPGEITWGDIGEYQVVAEYEVDGNPLDRNVTNLAVVGSSQANELQLASELPGFYRTIKAYGGRSYTLTAQFDGQSAEVQVKVLKRPMKLQIRNALGDPFRGQSVTLRAVLEQPDVIDDLPVYASWESLTPGLSLNHPSASEVVIST